MDFIKRNKGIIFWSILIVFLYLFLRLINLSFLPIFTDEAIYIRWAQIAANDANWRFISLTDGKQPMYVWFAMIFIKFIDDPLLAGRLVSVLCGIATLFGVYALTYEVFRKKQIAVLAALIYVCYPFAQVYDRMALYDSMVAAFYVWSIYFSIKLVRQITLSDAYTLGFLVGGGILTKSTNFFSIYLLPLTLLLFNFKEKHWRRQLFKWVILALFAVGIAEVFYGILRLSPLFTMVNTKNATFVFPFSEWIKHPTYFLGSNAMGLVDWLISYLKYPYIILISLSFFSFRKYWKEILFLIIYFLVPFLALLVFGKTLFPRFIFFMTMSLLPLVALGLSNVLDFISKKFYQKTKPGIFIRNAIVIMLFVGYSLYVSLQFAFNPLHADIPRIDAEQYVNSWSAGWGIKETVAFLEKESKDKKIFVATEGTFGLMPAALELYLGKNKNIIIKGYWPFGNDKLPDEVEENARKMPTYFVFYQPEHLRIAEHIPLKLVLKKQAGKSRFLYRVYQISK